MRISDWSPDVCSSDLGVLASFRPFFFSSSGAGVLCTQLVTSWPPSSRWPAMGAPMMPRPMNPIFAMTFRSFRLSLCGLFRRGAGGEVGAQPAEAPGGAGLGLVLAADPALVAHPVAGLQLGRAPRTATVSPYVYTPPAPLPLTPPHHTPPPP